MGGGHGSGRPLWGVRSAVGLLLAVAGGSGCLGPAGRPAGGGPAPDTPSVLVPAPAPVAASAAVLAESRFCRVSGTGDARRAARVCQAVSAVCGEFETHGWPLPERPLEVRLFHRWEEFEAAVGPGQVTPQYEGMANSQRGILYLFHEWQTDVRLLEIARHETTHLLLHENGGFRIPARYRPAPGQETLPAVPWWLEEGLASCMEVAADSRGPTAGLNRGRCRELQALVRAGRCPPVREVLALPLSTRGSPGHYAVAWGLVYAVLFPPPPAAHADGLAQLGRYLAACRSGFLADPEREFGARFLAPDGRPWPDFPRRWHEHVVRESILAFQRHFLPARRSLPEWEAQWRARMLGLNPDRPPAP